MVIFPLAPDQTIAQMWSNGVWGVLITELKMHTNYKAVKIRQHFNWNCGTQVKQIDKLMNTMQYVTHSCYSTELGIINNELNNLFWHNNTQRRMNRGTEKPDSGANTHTEREKQEAMKIHWPIHGCVGEEGKLYKRNILLTDIHCKYILRKWNWERFKQPS